MGAQIVSNYSISSDTLSVAREIARRCGKSSIVDPCDLEGTSITINGKRESLDYETLKDKKTEYGLEGAGISPMDLAVIMQAKADGGEILVSVGDRLIRIKTLPVWDKESFDARIVKSLTAAPKGEVPFRIDDLLKGGRFSYQDNNKYLLPWLFFATKTGDCNDFSIFAHYVLSRAGYEPRFFLNFNPQTLNGAELPESEDICAYSDKNGCWNYFDNTGLHFVNAPSIGQMFAASLPDYKWRVELQIEDGRVIVTEEDSRKVAEIRKQLNRAKKHPQVR